MLERVSWEEIQQELDLVAEDDYPGIIRVFLKFQHRYLDFVDTGGREQCVTARAFCLHFGFSRHKFANWLNEYGEQVAS